MALQKIMGWKGDRLYIFTIRGTDYGHTDKDAGGEGMEERLKDVLPAVGETFSYTYDFDDNWVHVLQIEKIVDTFGGGRYPVCLDGARACPPEGIGGMWAYKKYLETLNEPASNEWEATRDFVPGAFDSEEFDLTEVNDRLRNSGQASQL